MYNLIYSSNSKKDLQKLGTNIAKRITEKIFWFSKSDSIFTFKIARIFTNNSS